MLAVQRDDFVRAVYAKLDERAAEIAGSVLNGTLAHEGYVRMTGRRLGILDARQIVAEVLKGFERDDD